MNKSSIKISKLRSGQKKAIDFFNKNGYLIIEAARQTGKTITLQAIIEKNKDKKIGIITYSYTMYQCDYKELKCDNIKYLRRIPSEEELNQYKFDIILGDEVFIEPFSFNNSCREIKTACALTPRYIVKNLSIPKKVIEHIERMKKFFSKDQFEIEYGRFLNKK